MKPTITKEQAKAIESCAMNCGDTYKERLIRGHADDSGDWSGEYAPLNDLDIMTLAAALVNGYEVEKTPEEKCGSISKVCGRTIATQTIRLSKWHVNPQGLR